MFTRLLILFFLLPAALHCDTLKQTYTFVEPKIYSSDLIGGCPKHFEILQIPDGKTTYRINAKIIAKTYELNGCSIELGKVRYVNFTKQTSLDLRSLKHQVTDLFMTNYPTMAIQKLDVFPRGFIDSLPANPKAVFDKDAYDNNNGVFYVLDDNDIRRYFDYTIDGTLSILYSHKKIDRKETITSSNSILKLVPFTSFRGKPLVKLPDQAQRFRRTIREDEPILDRYLEPIPLVLRGSRVSVQVENGRVIVEFIATATQEGALYDIITIEKSDKKRAKAKVIGENKVELQ